MPLKAIRPRNFELTELPVATVSCILAGMLQISQSADMKSADHVASVHTMLHQ
jgi:hypothetical protein